jgi:hypothetical protein
VRPERAVEGLTTADLAYHTCLHTSQDDGDQMRVCGSSAKAAVGDGMGVDLALDLTGKVREPWARIGPATTTRKMRLDPAKETAAGDQLAHGVHRVVTRVESNGGGGVR